MVRRDKAPRQLELPGQPPLRPAPISDAHKTLAGALPERLYLGTSSWSFPGWRDLVYGHTYTPALLSSGGLHPYARHPLLRTVGIDSSHYQPLSQQTLRAYAEQTPPHFRFLMKAHEGCTLARFPPHKRYGREKGQLNPLFFDSGYARAQVIAPWIEAMRERAGVLLFQLAAQDVDLLGGASGFAERLGVFLKALPRGPKYAVELRNTRLLTPAYGRALADHNAVHCFNAHPSMPPFSRQMRLMGNPAFDQWVVRWMLHDGFRYEEAVARYRPFARIRDPDPQTRTHIVRLVNHAVARDNPVFVIVNNKAEGSAPLSIVALAMELAGLSL